MTATRVVTFASKALVNILAALGVLVAVAVAVCLFTGIRPVVFVSGSMSPTIGTGALALTAPVSAADIQADDIISVVREDGVRVSHRAVEVGVEDGTSWLTMRGDANTNIDADQYDVTEGADKVIWHVEELGRVVASIQVPWVLLGALALLIIAALPGARRPAEASTQPNMTTEERNA